MINKKISLFDVEVDSLTMNETVQVINDSIITNKQIVHNCINANKVVLMVKDKDLKKSLDDADIISADGQAIVWTSRLLNNPLPERVPGIDLMEALIQLASTKGYKVFLFGAQEEVVSKVSEFYNNQYKNKVVAGYRNGYYTKDEEEIIIEEIQDSGASMLFVAIPSPQKELFINRHKLELDNVNLLMGVGGSFDVIAGKVNRAPRWMQDNGLEWLFRLIQEPRKMWRRYLIGNTKFILLVLKRIFNSQS